MNFIGFLLLYVFHFVMKQVDVSEGSLFMLAFMNIMTKLRPVVHTFFIEASVLFDLRNS